MTTAVWFVLAGVGLGWIGWIGASLFGIEMKLERIARALEKIADKMEPR